jgi:hypothetical protein
MNIRGPDIPSTGGGEMCKLPGAVEPSRGVVGPERIRQTVHPTRPGNGQKTL